MRQKKLLFLSVQQVVFLVYFIITTMIFLISFNQGNEGITIRVFGGGDDGFFYWQQAKNIFDGKPAILTSIYPLIIGHLIKITGYESVYIIRLFNYLGFILFIFLCLNLLELFYSLDEKNKNLNHKIFDSKAMMLVMIAVYPSIIIYANLSIYRDIWIYLLYLACVIIIIKAKFNNRTINMYLILLLPFLWLLGSFRGYALVSFVLSNIVHILYKKIGKRKNTYLILVIFLILSGIYYTFFKELEIPYINMSLSSALDYRNSFLGEYAGGSQMMISLNQPNFIMFIINYFYSYIGNLIGPLPWQISGIATLVTFFVESILFLLILLYLWKKRRFISNVQKYVLLHAFVWISLIAIINDNLGTATRLRPVAWILIIIVFASIFPKIKSIQKRNYKKEIIENENTSGY